MRSSTDRVLTIKDSDGNEIRAGDLILFCYGIPPVGVEARVVERKGKLIALTAPHKPSECGLSKLKRHVVDFYKVQKLAVKPLEIEAAIFAGRAARSKAGSQ